MNESARTPVINAQCVAVCCSVLQCVAVCCRCSTHRTRINEITQNAVILHSVLQLCCSYVAAVLQCAAACGTHGTRMNESARTPVVNAQCVAEC